MWMCARCGLCARYIYVQGLVVLGHGLCVELSVPCNSQTVIGMRKLHIIDLRMDKLCIFII